MFDDKLGAKISKRFILRQHFVNDPLRIKAVADRKRGAYCAACGVQRR